MENYQKKAEENLIQLQHEKDQAQKNLLRITINEEIHNMHKIQARRSCVKDKPLDLEHSDE